MSNTDTTSLAGHTLLGSGVWSHVVKQLLLGHLCTKAETHLIKSRLVMRVFNSHTKASLVSQIMILLAALLLFDGLSLLSKVILRLVLQKA